MGVVAPVSVHLGPSAQPPINVSENFPVHVSAKLPWNIFPNPSEVISEVSELHDKSFEDIFEISQLSAQNRVGGLPSKHFDRNLPIYVTWKNSEFDTKYF